MTMWDSVANKIYNIHLIYGYDIVRSLKSEGYLRIIKNSECIVFLYWLIDIRLSSFLILLQKQILREMDPIEVTIWWLISNPKQKVIYHASTFIWFHVAILIFGYVYVEGKVKGT